MFTFKYALAGTILVNVLSLIMAVGLNSKIRCKSALRGIYFVPNILGGLVIGYIFSFILLTFFQLWEMCSILDFTEQYSCK